MTRGGRVRLIALSALGTIAVAGVAYWARDTTATPSCEERSVSPPQPPPLTDAERREAFRIVSRDPLVTQLFDGAAIRRSSSPAQPGVFVADVPVLREHVGLSAFVTIRFDKARAGKVRRFRTLGASYRNDCFGDGVTAYWTDDVEGPVGAMARETFLAEVNLGTGTVMSVIPAFSDVTVMRGVGSRHYLYQAR